MSEIDKILKKILIDPTDQTELLTKISEDGKIIEVSNKNGKRYQVIDGVIDFEGEGNYADNFGDQWTRFPKLQLDSFNKTTISKDRFFGALKLSSDKLKGKLILDVGCGTGRFAEIALQSGAKVIGLDYSDAAYVATKNLKHYPDFRAVRGNIYKLPFKKDSFDIVYCLGVLQHTPNVEKAYKSLPRIVKDSGLLTVDYYWKRFQSVLGWKYIIRLITSKLKESTTLKILKIVHPFFYLLSELISRIPYFGKALSRLIPVVNYVNDYPQLGKTLLREWSFLDTYDSWAPKFDKPQTVNTVKKWAKEIALENVEIEHVGQLVVRGKVKKDLF